MSPCGTKPNLDSLGRVFLCASWLNPSEGKRSAFSQIFVASGLVC